MTATRRELSALTTTEFAAWRPQVALIPVGANEQHGPNLAMGVDWRIAHELAMRIAERADPLAVVAPAIAYGLSAHHMSFEGTVSISAQTFLSLCTDVVVSLRRHGIKKIVFVNGHRGNESILGVLTTSLSYEHGVQAVSSFWMTQAADVIAKHRRSARWGHACEIETSVAMAVCPDIVRDADLQPGDHIEDDYLPYEDNYQPFALQVPRSFRSRTSNGVFGDARLASAEAGEQIVSTVVERVAEFVRAYAERDAPTP